MDGLGLDDILRIPRSQVATGRVPVRRRCLAIQPKEKPMLTPKIAGAVILGAPLILLAWVFLRRQRPVMWLAIAATLVGLGYLMATGATDDIANRLAPSLAAAGRG
jgi:hypothetical protein